MVKNQNKYGSFVLNLLVTTFGLTKRDLGKQDRAWNDWLKIAQEWRDVVALLKSDAKDAFKARAIAGALAPDAKLLPFNWKGEMGFSGIWDGVRATDLSPKLLDFTSAILQISIDEAPHLNYDPLTIWVLRALPRDDPHAAGLLKRYQLNDRKAFWNLDFSSGYIPFRVLLLDTAIHESWKKKVDARMRDIIRLEQEGRSKPRQEWEEALSCYTDSIGSGFFQKSFPYSADLLASQVDFILSLPNVKRQIFHSFLLHSVLTRLDGDARKPLRHRLARHTVLAVRGEIDAFVASGGSERDAAELMLKEFANDAKLAKRLRKLIVESDAQLRKERKANRRQQAKVDSVKARML